MFKKRQRVGKYLIEERIGTGGFSEVYRAMDTVEGIRVALKVPFDQHLNDSVMADFRKEVRMVARLEHPNILPLKNADFADDHFLIAFPLGESCLAGRMQHRMSVSLSLEYVEQLLKATAYAHQQRIIHCDIKPENLILFPDKHIKLTDFGIAKISLRTVRGSGSGTLGHMAPEQAMGKPSYRSDVFSIGLIMYRLFGGCWPEYPFEWPMPGLAKMKNGIHEDLIKLIRKSLDINPKHRYADASNMLNAYLRIKPRVLRRLQNTTTKRRAA